MVVAVAWVGWADIKRRTNAYVSTQQQQEEGVVEPGFVHVFERGDRALAGSWRRCAGSRLMGDASNDANQWLTTSGVC
jgi:hypothetical protein